MAKWFVYQEEKAYEVDHLEFLPPYTKSGLKYFDFTKNGITDITCLNTHEIFKLHNGDEYWNPNLKNEFMQRITRLWDESYYKEGVGKFEV